jgi:hypothetical protein
METLLKNFFSIPIPAVKFFFIYTGYRKVKLSSYMVIII